ncbi:MAG: hypothetical protein M1817_002110 [Caeruleum heppii]|nr:MAG: hypothetical protein M1817_002110 [Caeruleum heppii]
MSTLPAGNTTPTFPHSRPLSPSIVKWLDDIPNDEDSKKAGDFTDNSLQQPLQKPSQIDSSNRALIEEFVENYFTRTDSSRNDEKHALTSLVHHDIRRQGLSSSSTDLDMSQSSSVSTSVVSRATGQAAITLDVLEYCHPAIHYLNFAQANRDFSIPDAALNLYKVVELAQHEPRMPREFKERYEHLETLRKDQLAILPHTYDTNSYSHPEDITLLWETLNRIRDNADSIRSSTSEEDLCQEVVLPVLKAMSRCKRFQDRITELHLRTCGILPKSLCPRRRNETVAADDEIGPNFRKGARDPNRLDRKIDFGLALVLSQEERNEVKRYLPSVDLERRTLYQTNIGSGLNPPFVEFEIEKDGAAVDAKIQIGVWTAAWFAKCHQEGWSTANTTHPMIVVRQDDWDLYVTFEAVKEGESVPRVVVMGPISFGNTTRDIDAYRILKVMTRLCEWGDTTNRAWWQSVVLPQLRTE